VNQNRVMIMFKQPQTSGDARAIIWDLDGVIADTAPYHMRAWQDTFQKMGIQFTEDDFRHSFGLRNDTILAGILGKGVSRDEINSISTEKEETFRRMIGQNIRPLPGVIDLMRSLTEAGFPMALASSTPAENVRLVTERLGIKDYFQSTIAAEDVTKGKPHPQVFLLAAQELGVSPGNCAVIEDAVAGITAARRAGMHCLAVTTTHPRASLKEADLIVDTLESVTVNTLQKLLAHSSEL